MGLTRESKMIYCKRCKMYRAFSKENDKWICCKCKKESKNGKVITLK